MTTKAQREQMEESREYLRKLLKPGDTVYTVVRHVARSGMSRVISTLITSENGELLDISRHVAWATRSAFDHDRWGLKVNGTGMNMCFDTVYRLGRALWPEGVPCTGSNGRTPTGRKTKANRCLSNEHVNDHTMTYRKSRVHRDGGYALQYRDI